MLHLQLGDSSEAPGVITQVWGGDEVRLCPVSATEVVERSSDTAEVEQTPDRSSYTDDRRQATPPSAEARDRLRLIFGPPPRPVPEEADGMPTTSDRKRSRSPPAVASPQRASIRPPFSSVWQTMYLLGGHQPWLSARPETCKA
jgi:hypothetical protein